MSADDEQIKEWVQKQLHHSAKQTPDPSPKLLRGVLSRLPENEPFWRFPKVLSLKWYFAPLLVIAAGGISIWQIPALQKFIFSDLFKIESSERREETAVPKEKHPAKPSPATIENESAEAVNEHPPAPREESKFGLDGGVAQGVHLGKAPVKTAKDKNTTDSRLRSAGNSQDNGETELAVKITELSWRAVEEGQSIEFTWKLAGLQPQEVYDLEFERNIDSGFKKIGSVSVGTTGKASYYLVRMEGALAQFRARIRSGDKVSGYSAILTIRDEIPLLPTGLVFIPMRKATRTSDDNAGTPSMMIAWKKPSGLPPTSTELKITSSSGAVNRFSVPGHSDRISFAYSPGVPLQIELRVNALRNSNWITFYYCPGKLVSQENVITEQDRNAVQARENSSQTLPIISFGDAYSLLVQRNEADLNGDRKVDFKDTLLVPVDANCPF